MWRRTASIVSPSSTSFFSSSSISLSQPTPSLAAFKPTSSLSSSSRLYSNKTESFLSGTSASYEEQMYDAWKKDPSSVHASWAAYFSAVDAGVPAEAAHSIPYNLGVNENIKVPIGAAVAAAPVAAAPGAAATQATAWEIDASLRLFSLVRAYWRNGHIKADLDPLNRRKEENLQPRFVPLDLNPEYWGFTEAEMDMKIPIAGRPPLLSMTGRTSTTAREVLAELEKSYCGKIGVEFTHVNNTEMVNFLREKVENPLPELDKTERMMIYDRLAWGDLFENFLATKYGGAKRFGLEGCEALIPGIKALIDTAAHHGCEEMLIGMPHRGRLNTLANVIRKPLAAIFCEFKGQNPLEEGSGTGDVKYHLGTSYIRNTNAGEKIRLSLAANPSHLEAVNPVVCGRARARQDARGDHTGKHVCALLMHGDAAFAGQGVVYESLHLNDLPKYTTRGSIHIVVNNQIGFTTDPRDARSTPHPTDVAKNVNAPIVHVNADDVEAVVHVFKMAAEFRQIFQEDFVIDLVGYRRHGHNEIDPCEMTQPLMYKLIGKHQPVLKKYEQFLLDKNVCTEQEMKEITDKIKHKLESGFEEAKSYKTKDKEWLESRWSNYKRLWEKTGGKPRPTNIDGDRIKKIGSVLTNLPEGFTPHKQIKKLLEKKKHMFETGEGFDWGTAEALAFGSLVQEGVKVRLSGQDSERGTFSHRHAVLHDQKNWREVYPSCCHPK
uniref:2-oxoglutarate dehydrogenase, mitochondrial n=1 Tax=Paramoeba aestuarina TaxID=180227 RepID=A0A7S4UG30_9EUKA|mmetsp:Transcript_39818/g.62936  ORF Transcript_39818/g.62936 Transcript_39818/m.62936 type:complete len:719 (+) Transcript_39818:88-2244(+)